MPPKLRKTISLLLCASLLFTQSGLAQVLPQLNPALLPQPTPLLRYLSVNSANPSNYFNFLLDKGLSPQGTDPDLNSEAKKLISYFFLGLTLPSEAFWVNLKPLEPERITSAELSKTDLGRTLLEQDLQLKKDVAKYLHPHNPQGKLYWERLYSTIGRDKAKKATITSSNRVWIVPEEAVVLETEDGALVAKASLKVLLESEYLSLKEKKWNKEVEAKVEVKDEIKQLSENLMQEIILPAITQDINTSPTYAPLRQIYHSLILAEWYKRKQGLSPSLDSTQDRQGTVPETSPYAPYINSGTTQGLESELPWEKQAIWQEYLKSYQQGEYKLQDSLFGLKRMYWSGGATFASLSSQGAGSPITVIAKEKITEYYQAIKDKLYGLGGILTRRLPNTNALSPEITTFGKEPIKPEAPPTKKDGLPAEGQPEPDASKTAVAAGLPFVEKLRQNLMLAGLLNYEGGHLYDISDPRTTELYQQALREALPQVEPRDTVSWRQINALIGKHLETNPGSALIVVSGVARHFWGALPDLERQYSVAYISTANTKLSIPVLLKNLEKGNDEIEKILSGQLKRDVNVMKYLGYESFEAFIHEREAKLPKAKHVIVGLEETGIHGSLYFDEGDGAYKYLAEFLQEFRPASVLFIGEDLHVDRVQQDYQKGTGVYPARDRFFLQAKKMNIRVNFAAFGEPAPAVVGTKPASSPLEEKVDTASSAITTDKEGDINDIEKIIESYNVKEMTNYGLSFKDILKQWAKTHLLHSTFDFDRDPAIAELEKFAKASTDEIEIKELLKQSFILDRQIGSIIEDIHKKLYRLGFVDVRIAKIVFSADMDFDIKVRFDLNIDHDYNLATSTRHLGLRPTDFNLQWDNANVLYLDIMPFVTKRSNITDIELQGIIAHEVGHALARMVIPRLANSDLTSVTVLFDEFIRLQPYINIPVEAKEHIKSVQDLINLGEFISNWVAFQLYGEEVAKSLLSSILREGGRILENERQSHLEKNNRLDLIAFANKIGFDFIGFSSRLIAKAKSGYFQPEVKFFEWLFGQLRFKTPEEISKGITDPLQFKGSDSFLSLSGDGGGTYPIGAAGQVRKSIGMGVTILPSELPILPSNVNLFGHTFIQEVVPENSVDKIASIGVAGSDNQEEIEKAVSDILTVVKADGGLIHFKPRDQVRNKDKWVNLFTKIAEIKGLQIKVRDGNTNIGGILFEVVPLKIDLKVLQAIENMPEQVKVMIKRDNSPFIVEMLSYGTLAEIPLAKVPLVYGKRIVLFNTNSRQYEKYYFNGTHWVLERTSWSKIELTRETQTQTEEKVKVRLTSSPLQKDPLYTPEVGKGKGGIDLSQIELSLKDEKFVSSLNPAERQILLAAKYFKDGWESLSLLYIHQIMLLLKDNLIRDIQNKDLLFGILRQLQIKDFLDPQAIQFLNFLHSQRPISEIKLTLLD